MDGSNRRINTFRRESRSATRPPASRRDEHRHGAGRENDPEHGDRSGDGQHRERQREHGHAIPDRRCGLPDEEQAELPLRERSEARPQLQRYSSTSSSSSALVISIAACSER